MTGTLGIFLLVIVCLSAATGRSVQGSCLQPILCQTFDPADCSKVLPAHFTFGGQTCPGCDVCVPNDFDESTRCINMGCPMIYLPEGCLHPRFHNQYYELNGNTCEACGALTC